MTEAEAIERNNIVNQKGTLNLTQEPKQFSDIQTNLLRWLVYSALMFALLFFLQLPWLQHIGAALILGHFSAQLNALIYKTL